MALASPASDDRRFWDRLRTRVDTILEDRRDLPAAAAPTVISLLLTKFSVCFLWILNPILTCSVSRGAGDWRSAWWSPSGGSASGRTP